MVGGHSPVVVLGAGAAGLSTAYHLGDICEVFEKEREPGGHCRAKQVDGFLFDEGAHVFFGKGECAETYVWKPLANELVRKRAEIWNNYGAQRYGRYPVQVNAHALPPELATECVLGFLDAVKQDQREVRSYADWCYASFGRPFADNFMLRYARKIWTVEPEELTTDWLGSSVGGRVSRPTVEQVIRGAIDPEPQLLSYLVEFAYPVSGGFQRILDPIRTGVRSLRPGASAVEIDAARRTVRFSEGSEREYEALVSTIPLPELVRITRDAPPEVRAAAGDLKWTSVRCVNLGIARPDVGRGHWVYFYDPQVPFFRVSFPHRLSPGNAPPGHGSVSCEIAYSRRRPLEEEGLGERVKAALVEAGILRREDRVLFEDQVDIPYAYVVYDFSRARALEAVHGWMRRVGLYPCGRYAEWGYHWSFDALESGRRVALQVEADLDVKA